MPSWLQYVLAVSTGIATIAVAFIAARQWIDSRFYLRAWISTEWKVRSSPRGPYVRLSLVNLGQTPATDFLVTYWLQQPNHLPEPVTATLPARLVPKARSEVPLYLADTDQWNAFAAGGEDCLLWVEIYYPDIFRRDWKLTVSGMHGGPETDEVFLHGEMPEVRNYSRPEPDAEATGGGYGAAQ